VWQQWAAEYDIHHADAHRGRELPDQPGVETPAGLGTSILRLV
jgi:hypothetical protein